MITPSFSPTATERVLPKLALDFTTASLDSRVTFTRTTGASNPATYVNSSGYVTAATNNQPRFDYDPVALTCKGLLIEESRTNFLQYSSRPDTLPWLVLGTSVSFNVTATTAPDNTLTGVLANNTGTSPSLFYQIVPTTTCGTGAQSCSVYAKKGASDLFTLNTYWDTEAETNTTFTLTGSGSTNNPSMSSIAAVGNGWFRCIVNHPARTGAGTNFNYRVWPAGRGVSSTTGTYFWGFQQEAGAFPTSYIPTTSAALTRNADVATMTGTNFSSWFNASEGAFEVEYSLIGANPASPGYDQGIITVDDGISYANSINLNNTNGSGTMYPQYSVFNGGTGQVLINSAAVTIGATVKFACAYKLNDFASCKNGSSIGTDTSGTVPSGMTSAFLGQNYLGSTRSLNGYLKKINYYKQRIINAEVQAFSK